MITATFAEWKLRMWLNAISLQGDRIFQSEHASRNVPSHASVDAHFFVIATRNALRWAKSLEELAPSLKPVLSDFAAHLPTAIDLRDMLEHEDEYAKGVGRKQAKFVQGLTVNNGKLNIKGVRASLLIRSDEGFIVGGRLSVERTIELAESLLRQIQS